MSLLSKEIERFLAVVDCGSVLAAAHKLNLTQPAVTASIKKLEAELDSALFDRSSIGMKLTYAGDAFLTYAQRVQSELLFAQRDLAALSGQSAGKLRIGAGPAWATGILPEAIGTFSEENKNAEFTLLLRPPPSVVKMLIKGEIELFAGSLEAIESSGTSDLVVKQLLAIQDIMLVRKGHPVLEDVSTMLRSTTLDPVTLLNDPFGHRRVDKYLASLGAPLNSSRISVSSAVAACQIVLHSNAAVVVPHPILSTLDLTNLAVVPLEMPAFPSGIAYRRSIAKLPLFRRFVTVIEDVVRSGRYDRRVDMYGLSGHFQ